MSLARVSASPSPMPRGVYTGRDANGATGSAAPSCTSNCGRPGLRRDRRPLSVEDGIVGLVDQRLGTFRRELLGIVLGAVDVAFPDLARQLVEDLDPVAVGIRDVHAVRHAV